MSLHTLRAMANGGIYDQVGGGFARYAVDALWIVPHFEKMLYDNALLARAYLHGWQVVGRRAAAARVRGDARLGAARAAPGRGRLRLARWTPTPRASRASSTSGRSPRCATCSATSRGGDRYFGMTEGGNFEGAEHPGARGAGPAGAGRDRRRELLERARAARAAGARRQAADVVERAGDLRARRRRRGARQRADYLDAARACRRLRAATTMRDGEGRLLRTYNRGAGAAARLPRGPRATCSRRC